MGVRRPDGLTRPLCVVWGEGGGAGGRGGREGGRGGRKEGKRGGKGWGAGRERGVSGEERKGGWGANVRQELLEGLGL